MTAKQFNDWLAAMKAAGLARFDTHAADALGISRQMVREYKLNGTRQIQTDYACAALLAGLSPYPDQ